MITKLDEYASVETTFVGDFLKYDQTPAGRELLRKVFGNILSIHMSYSRGIVLLLKQEGDFTITCGTILRSALENFVNFYYLSKEDGEVLQRYINAVNYPKRVGKEKFKCNIEKGNHYYKSPLTDKRLKEKLEKINIKPLNKMYDLLCDYTHGNPWITSIQPNQEAFFDFAFRGLVIITASIVALSGITQVSDGSKAHETKESLLKLVGLDDSVV